MNKLIALTAYAMAQSLSNPTSHPEWFVKPDTLYGFEYAILGTAKITDKTLLPMDVEMRLGRKGCIVGPFEFVMGENSILSIPPGYRLPEGCASGDGK